MNFISGSRTHTKKQKENKRPQHIQKKKVFRAVNSFAVNAGGVLPSASIVTSLSFRDTEQQHRENVCVPPDRQQSRPRSTAPTRHVRPSM